MAIDTTAVSLVISVTMAGSDNYFILSSELDELTDKSQAATGSGKSIAKLEQSNMETDLLVQENMPTTSQNEQKTIFVTAANIEALNDQHQDFLVVHNVYGIPKPAFLLQEGQQSIGDPLTVQPVSGVNFSSTSKPLVLLSHADLMENSDAGSPETSTMENSVENSSVNEHSKLPHNSTPVLVTNTGREGHISETAEEPQEQYSTLVVPHSKTDESSVVLDSDSTVVLQVLYNNSINAQEQDLNVVLADRSENLESADVTASETAEYKRHSFKCDLCSASFNRLGNYTRHRMVHAIDAKVKIEMLNESRNLYLIL